MKSAKVVFFSCFFTRILSTFYAHFVHATIFNFLTEPDTDMFIENKKFPYRWVSPNIVKNIYWVHECAHAVCNFLTEPDTDMFIENKNVLYGRFSPNIMKNLYRVFVCAHARAQLFNGARYRHIYREQKCFLW